MCPAVYIAIFRSHIHISATFWWLVAAALPTKTTLDKEPADPGSEPRGWAPAAWGPVQILLTWCSHTGAVSGPGDTGPRRLCQGHNTQNTRVVLSPAPNLGKNTIPEGRRNTDPTKEHKSGPRGRLKENGPANTRDGGKWKGHSGGRHLLQSN